MQTNVGTCQIKLDKSNPFYKICTYNKEQYNALQLFQII